MLYLYVCRLASGGAEKEAGGTAASFRGSNASLPPTNHEAKPSLVLCFSMAKLEEKRKEQ